MYCHHFVDNQILYINKNKFVRYRKINKSFQNATSCCLLVSTESIINQDISLNKDYQYICSSQYKKKTTR